MSKRRLITSTATILAGIALALFASPITAGAAGFNQNNVIDDGVFDNTTTMSATQIDDWLNANFGNTSCISTAHGFTALDPTGYNPTNGFTFGGSVSAGHVIYDAATAYDLNPQVLLTTLQKEQGLVTGTDGCSTLRYTGAAGYGCPDGGTTYNYSGLNLYSINGVAVTSVSGTCVNTAQKAGFSQQLIRAAWLLKFGEQRSEGNINWAIIRGNWNNSDDPQSCYGGPMTQGTWQRCPSGASAFYDGYTTIDGTAVHMDDGATAALYWYTPHFAGNQSFYNIFTGWFGSTQFPQPTGGLLYYQPSTGKIYLATDSTRYYISSWAMMVDYGLDAYPTLTASDATISALTDGGTLTNTIWNDNGVFLVNNRTKYHVTGAMCTAWGLACSDSTITHRLGAAFDTGFLRLSGTDLPPVMTSGNAYYLMSAGNRQPFADTQSITASGYSTGQALVANTVNASQPLGALILKTTPGVIKFSQITTSYYFDGTTYHAIPSPAIMSGWGLDKLTAIHPPLSTFDSAGQPSPLGAALTSWYQTQTSQKYLMNLDAKYALSASQQSLWPSAVYTTGAFADTLANTLPAVTLQTNIWSDPGIYVLGSDSKKHHVPTYADYIGLGINSSNTTSLSPDIGNAITTGSDALANGKVIGIQDGLYVVNDSQLIHIPTAAIFNVFGFSWSNIPAYPSSIETDYPLASVDPSKVKTSDGSYSFTATGKRLNLTPSLAIDFGLKTNLFTSISAGTSAHMAAPTTLSRFLYNTDDGRIYYASGGAIHYVSSYSAFVAYGGLRTPASSVTTDMIQSFVVGQNV